MASESHGIGFLGALGLLFIGLKLAGIITWAWLWVLMPLWPGLIAIAIVLVWFVVLMFIFMIEGGVTVHRTLNNKDN